jgi:hypothetical protein
MSEKNIDEIQGISVSVPKIPPRKTIQGYGKKKREQKWERNPLPSNWDTMSEGARSKFVEQEFIRRRDGYWFYNNGEPTYITGLHYYYLNWCKIDVGYPSYWDRDRRFFLVWESCIKDNNCYGLIMPKHRRQGASWKAAAIVLEGITSMYNSNGGIMSKTGADSKKLFDKVVYLFRQLPPFFQPIIEGTDSPKTVLSFKKPGERITKNKQTVSKSEALNSQIDWRNTKNNSYDGDKLAIFVSDEGGKWLEADVSKNWQIVKPALSQGRKIVGKAFLPSTVNEMEAGGKSFKDIWDDSDQNDKVVGTNRTRSGLYRYFTEAYDGYEGFIDEYGMSVIHTPTSKTFDLDGDEITIGSKEYLSQIRDGLKNDTNKLAEHKRQFPWTPEEAFRVSVDTCLFDAEKIYQQIEYLEVVGPSLTSRGNFIWKNAEQDSEVRWIPDKKGKWDVSWVPPNDVGINKKRPPNQELLVAGCDPFDHDVTTDGRRSNGAAYVFKKFNIHEEESHMFVAEYINRPPKAEMFYEDMLKMCVFYGCQILVENNKIGLLQYFKKRGYEKYLMARPESTHTKFSKTRQVELGLPTTGQAVISAMTDALQAYVYDYIGIREDGTMGNLFFFNLLKDLLEFDATNRTKFDASMAAGITLLAAQKNIKPKIEKKVYIPFVKKYNNTGVISKLIK